jgi:sugar phosphate isomerase/epimerase
MNVRDWRLPFRVGATSYIIDGDLVANAGFLAAHVQDMQLVLFDLPDGPSNLPDAAAVTHLADIGARRDLTYTVHLIDDLATPASQRTAQHVIDLTRALAPGAWVGHLDGRDVRTAADDMLAGWRAQVAPVVAEVGAAAGAPARLAIENLEGYAPEFVTPVVAATGASRCVDVGHLWLDGHDPVAPLLTAWPRLRVIHLHGVSGDRTESHRDHRSLALTPPTQLDGVVHLLLERAFTGVLTLEIFGEADFWSSLAALAASVRRYRGE